MHRLTPWMIPSCLAMAFVGCATEGRDGGEAKRPLSVKQDATTMVVAPSGIGADAGPTVRIVSPSNGAVAGSSLRVEGEASDDRSIASVLVTVGPNAPRLAQSQDGFKHWWLDCPVPPGMFSIEVQALDGGGQESGRERVALVGPVGGTDGAKPSVTISSPADGSAQAHPEVLVRGTTTDDRAVVSMQVLRNGKPVEEPVRVETDDFFANWSSLVPLLPGVDNELSFVAKDGSGHEGKRSLRVFGRANVDRAAPQVTVSHLQYLGPDRVRVTGEAGSAAGVREVKIRVGGRSFSHPEPAWGPYVAAETQDGFATWSKVISVPYGAFLVEARAISGNGLAADTTHSAANTNLRVWGDEVRVPLSLHDQAEAPSFRFELDKQGVNEVIAQDIQRDTVVLELDTTALLTNTLNEIKDSCGTDWRKFNSDPHHDCSLTELGRSFGSDWRSSAEYSFVRVLTMTPSNVVVAGTSLERVRGLAEFMSVGGGFSQILSNTLGIPLNQEVVSTAGAVRALQTFWMAGHPAVLPGAKLPVTLYDAMHEFAPTRERFGPEGGHPGLLDPSFTPHSVVFGPDFRLELAAKSNLRWLDGVDLTVRGEPGKTAKDYMAVVVDRTGPSYDDVLEFDFTDPAKFDVRGLVARPTLDLRMSMRENDQFIRACLDQSDVCKSNLPESPRAGYVWANPPWQVESVFAAGAYYDYRDLPSRTHRYFKSIAPAFLSFLVPAVQAAEIKVGVNGPPGWTDYTTALNMGRPPPDQYIWDSILEVAQVALHRFGSTTLAEGDADVTFTMRDVDVGLSADDIRSAMRAPMQAQRHTLSARLLGNYQANNGLVDFFYRRSWDGKPSLYFVSPGDPRPTTEYTYPKPGFFADPELTNKRSAKSNPFEWGPNSHEVLKLQPGETTVYVADESGQTYRLRVVMGADPAQIEIFVAQRAKP